MRKTKKNIVILIGVALLTGPVYGSGKKDEPLRDGALVSGQTVEITGKIRVVGNMPFPELVITDETEQDWFIPEEYKALFTGQDGQPVKVKAKVDLVELSLADNTRIGYRRILRQIKKIEPKK
ncbi:MAG: hypothetical protein LBG90_02950 [Spirochaetaceae bacterium]|jgi:hypothetical protein|nr:hypothetical protein [Spirochaetaceae bacterium]